MLCLPTIAPLSGARVQEAPPQGPGPPASGGLPCPACSLALTSLRSVTVDRTFEGL